MQHTILKMEKLFLLLLLLMLYNRDGAHVLVGSQTTINFTATWNIQRCMSTKHAATFVETGGSLLQTLRVWFMVTDHQIAKNIVFLTLCLILLNQAFQSSVLEIITLLASRRACTGFGALKTLKVVLEVVLQWHVFCSSSRV